MESDVEENKTKSIWYRINHFDWRIWAPLALIAIGIYFFWVRPSQIRSDCAKSVKGGGLDLSYIRDPQAKRPEEIRELRYFECLREHGLEAPVK